VYNPPEKLHYEKGTEKIFCHIYSANTSKILNSVPNYCIYLLLNCSMSSLCDLSGAYSGGRRCFEARKPNMSGFERPLYCSARQHPWGLMWLTCSRKLWCYSHMIIDQIFTLESQILYYNTWRSNFARFFSACFFHLYTNDGNSISLCSYV